MKEDRGMYQCFVRNDYDAVQSTAEIRLGGKYSSVRYSFFELGLNLSTRRFLVPHPTLFSQTLITQFYRGTERNALIFMSLLYV